MHGKRWTLDVVDQCRDSPIRVQSQEPLLLLHIRADVDQRRRPFRAVRNLQLFKQDLHGLTVRGGLRDEMEALGVLDVVGGLADVEFVGHVGAVECFLVLVV